MLLPLFNCTLLFANWANLAGQRSRASPLPYHLRVSLHHVLAMPMNFRLANAIHLQSDNSTQRQSRQCHTAAATPLTHGPQHTASHRLAAHYPALPSDGMTERGEMSAAARSVLACCCCTLLFAPLRELSGR